MLNVKLRATKLQKICINPSQMQILFFVKHKISVV